MGFGLAAWKPVKRPAWRPFINGLATPCQRLMEGSRGAGKGVMGNGIAECSLAELVEDPLIGLLMKSDGVDRRTVELLLARVARKRAQGVDECRSFPPDDEVAPCSAC